MQVSKSIIFDKDQISKDVFEAAQHEVEGFVLHDHRRYVEGAIHFSKSYLIINKYRRNPVSNEGAMLAGMHKMGVLKNYDTIVDDPTITVNYADITQNHQNFRQMMHHALEESRLFNLPQEFGRNKVDWYMQHADWVKNLNSEFPTNFPFLEKLKDCERAFVKGVTGGEALFHQTWPIYLTCVILHDMTRTKQLQQHEKATIDAMVETYSAYLRILFRYLLNNNR